MSTYSRTTRVPALIIAVIAAVILLWVGQLASAAVDGASQISSTDTYTQEG